MNENGACWGFQLPFAIAFFQGRVRRFVKLNSTMFRRFFSWAAPLLLLSCVGTAQPLPDRAPIRGVVVDEAGRPVASAVVTLRRQDEASPTAFWGAEARADKSGQFVIPTAEIGQYFLNVDAPNFASLTNVPLDWSLTSAPARLKLQRLTKLSLRVLAPDGAPLGSAPVWIRLRGGEAGQILTRTATNQRGEVGVPNIAPATYSVAVVAQNGIWTQSALAVPSPLSAPLEVRLREGATLRIKATSDGKPLGGASLVLFPQSPEEATRLGGEGADPGENWALVSQANAPQATVTRDRDGTLEVRHLPPGRFSARLSLPGSGAQPRDFTLEEGKTVEWNATFPPAHMATLSLRVVDARGQAVPDALVALRLLPLAANGAFEDEQTAPDLNAPPDVPLALFGFAARVGRTGGDGKLVLFPLRAGRYRVFASRPQSDSWLRSPVAPEGAPSDVVVSPNGSNTVDVQVP